MHRRRCCCVLIAGFVFNPNGYWVMTRARARDYYCYPLPHRKRPAFLILRHAPHYLLAASSFTAVIFFVSRTWLDGIASHN